MSLLLHELVFQLQCGSLFLHRNSLLFGTRLQAGDQPMTGFNVTGKWLFFR